MSTKRPTKRKRGTGPLIVGHVDTAQLATPTTINETKKDGTVVSKQVWKSLDTPTEHVPTVENLSEIPAMEHDIFDPGDVSSPQPETRNTYSVSRLQYWCLR